MPISHAMVASEVDPERRGLAQGVAQNLGSNLLGSFAAPVVLVALRRDFGWREAFYLAGVPGHHQRGADVVPAQGAGPGCAKPASRRRAGDDDIAERAQGPQHVDLRRGRRADGRALRHHLGVHAALPGRRPRASTRSRPAAGSWARSASPRRSTPSPISGLSRPDRAQAGDGVPAVPVGGRPARRAAARPGGLHRHGRVRPVELCWC